MMKCMSVLHKSHAPTLATSVSVLCSWAVAAAAGEGSAEKAKALLAELKGYNCKIVYETYRDGNWELFIVDADGANPVNLTRTPKVHELYPKVSPDGTKICFVADEGEGEAKIRNVYVMDVDGASRTLVAKNARQPCWKRDGTAIAYLKGEFDEFCYKDFATKGIVSYDLKTREHTEHPNKTIHHLYNLCWSPDGKWFLATVHGGMGYKHAILAIEADGQRVVNLKIPGCRPDISRDGKQVAWGPTDYDIRVGTLDLTGPTPEVRHQRAILTSSKPMKIYHIDWSPGGRYVTFSRGPKDTKKRLTGTVAEMVGCSAPGWNICVADPKHKNRWAAITSDGHSNKEPDWVPVAEPGR